MSRSRLPRLVRVSLDTSRDTTELTEWSVRIIWARISVYLSAARCGRACLRVIGHANDPRANFIIGDSGHGPVEADANRINQS